MRPQRQPAHESNRAASLRLAQGRLVHARRLGIDRNIRETHIENVWLTVSVSSAVATLAAVLLTMTATISEGYGVLMTAVSGSVGFASGLAGIYLHDGNERVAGIVAMCDESLAALAMVMNTNSAEHPTVGDFLDKTHRRLSKIESTLKVGKETPGDTGAKIAATPGTSRMRRHQRIKPTRTQTTITLIASGKIAPATILDVSLSGVGVKTAMEIKHGDLVQIGRHKANVVAEFGGGIGCEFLTPLAEIDADIVL